MSWSRVVIVDEQTTFSTTPHPPSQEYPARAMVNKDNS